MNRVLFILLGVSFLAPPCNAEARWCSISGISASDTMPYPPIARAAHIYGVVIGRIRFLPSGAVTGFDPVFGPAMLANDVTEQIRRWTIKTSADGQEPCQGLAIFKFSLDPFGGTQGESNGAEISASTGVLSFFRQNPTAMLV